MYCGLPTYFAFINSENQWIYNRTILFPSWKSNLQQLQILFFQYERITAGMAGGNPWTASFQHWTLDDRQWNCSEVYKDQSLAGIWLEAGAAIAMIITATVFLPRYMALGCDLRTPRPNGIVVNERSPWLTAAYHHGMKQSMGWFLADSWVICYCQPWMVADSWVVLWFGLLVGHCRIVEPLIF